jgi:hypothetical protein
MQARRFTLLVILCLLVAASGWSQESRGTILGRITDPSGAVIPGAQVVVTNTAMGTKTTVTTNGEGMYVAPLLPPGIYQVEASNSGFKKAVRNGIELRIADRLDISIALEIGAADQQVVVTGEAPLLQSESASLGTVIDSKRVASLPVSYGNPFLLIGLTAGVTFNGSVRLDRPFEPTHIVNFSMGGTSGTLNDITIDGAPTTSRANGNQVTASYVPPTDIVQEFKVQTATFDAQFGQTQGGVTNMSIKSGTNEFHGTARYQFQRPSFWANDFFNNLKGLPTPAFSLNTWGGSLGGPVRIPKVYDGRNKTFFMFGYEGLHDSRPRHDDTSNTVPTPAMHNGDFSSLLSNSSYTIYDPKTRVVSGGHWTETAFPGNIIPSSRFDPVGKSILSYYPTTETSPGQANAFGVGNYADQSVTEKAKYYNDTFKVDQNLGDRQRFFVRYSSYIRNSTYNNYFGDTSPFVGTQFWFWSKEASFDHVFTLSPTTVLNTRYSYNRFVRGSDGPAAGEGFDVTGLGFSSTYGSQVPKSIARFPRINLQGYISNGFTGEQRPTNNQSVAATISKAQGAHSLRFGFEYRVYQQADAFFSNSQTGQFTFASAYTKASDTASASPSNIGQSVAALLLGLPDSASITRSADYVEQSGVWGFFIQDDWKLTPKLTLNAGMRWEIETPLHERYNRSLLGFDTTYKQSFADTAASKYATALAAMSAGYPLLPASAFTVNGGMTFPGINGNGNGLYNTPKDVFLPRIGLAYQIDNKTVIRTGFGMFAGFLGQRRGDVQQAGFSANTNMTLLSGQDFLPLTTLSNPFPNGVSEPTGNSQGYATYLGQGFTYFNQNPKVPMSMRWELSLQRQFHGFLLDTAYVGNKTNHLEVTRNINPLPAQYWSYMYARDNAWNTYYSKSVTNPFYGLVPGNTQGTYTGTTTAYRNLLYPYPEYGSNALNTTDNTGYSWYHSLQVALTKRFSKGYTLSGSYTFSKWMQAVNLLNAIDLRPVEELADNDAPHRFNISGVWELPFGKGRALLANANPVVSRIVGGWQMSGIWNLQSGFPLIMNNAIFYGDPSSIILPADQRNPSHWFNIAGFVTASGDQPLSNQYRTWPRVFSGLRRQRINNMDLALIKNTRITEGKEIQFRAEALNAFNHPYFPAALMTVTTAQSASNAGFGQISASTMDNYARRLQLTLKFQF